MSELASIGVPHDEVVSTANAELVTLLHLRDCHFELGAPRQPIKELRRDGTRPSGRHRMADRHLGSARLRDLLDSHQTWPTGRPVGDRIRKASDTINLPSAPSSLVIMVLRRQTHVSGRGRLPWISPMSTQNIRPAAAVWAPRAIGGWA
jgi:hypothetical protein